MTRDSRATAGLIAAAVLLGGCSSPGPPPTETSADAIADELSVSDFRS